MTNTTLMAESGHDRILQIQVTELRPSPENELVYKPVLLDDPRIIELADDMRNNGVLEPLVVTRDNYIVSGHRRHAAARLAGLTSVPCRVLGRTRREYGDSYPALLADYNQQRVKSPDELVREKLVRIDPDEAYSDLLAYRRKRAAPSADLDQIRVEGRKVRAEISDAKTPMLIAVLDVLDGLEDYWPVSVRQVHYGLLNDPPLRHASKPKSHYANNQNSYDDLTDLLTRARFEGTIPFEAIDDPTRPVTTWAVHPAVDTFVAEQMDAFLRGYARDLQRSQPCHIEVIGEKNTIATIIKPVCAEYCVPVMVSRGYSSTPPKKAIVDRFKRTGKDRLTLLVLSDFDPEGEDIARNLVQSLHDDFGLSDVTGHKVTLTHYQVLDLGLPPNFSAKKDSSRYEAFAKRYGDAVYELEAVQPEQLQQYLRETIEAVMDRDLFEQECAAEQEDSRILRAYRQQVLDALPRIGP